MCPSLSPFRTNSMTYGTRLPGVTEQFGNRNSGSSQTNDFRYCFQEGPLALRHIRG
jgi:hypothetical protein